MFFLRSSRRLLPNRKSIKVRRHILKKITAFRTLRARSDRCESTIEIPIIHVNHGKTTSATVRPFQTKPREAKELSNHRDYTYQNGGKIDNHLLERINTSIRR